MSNSKATSLAWVPQPELMTRLNALYDEQEKDEWPPAKAKKIRDDIDEYERELRFRRSR